MHVEYYLMTLIVIPECCLDADWLTDSRFVTSGSDGVINVMNVGQQKPLKTLV